MEFVFLSIFFFWRRFAKEINFVHSCSLQLCVGWNGNEVDDVIFENETAVPETKFLSIF